MRLGHTDQAAVAGATAHPRHRPQWPQNFGEQIHDSGPFGVQMLFDGAGLDQAYMSHNAFAIPGAAHPVVSGPASDMLYTPLKEV